MHARKLLLAVLVGGPILGALAGLAVDPTMVPPPEPLWRHPAKAVVTPTEAYYQVEAPPQDLNPYLAPPGYRALMARREAAARRYQASLEPVADMPAYEVDARDESVPDGAAQAPADTTSPQDAVAAPLPVPVAPPMEAPAAPLPPTIVL